MPHDTQPHLAHCLRIYKLLPEDLGKWPTLIESQLSRVPPEMCADVRQWLRDMYRRVQCQRAAKRLLGRT